MRMLLVVGLVVLVLGILSFFVPFPHSENHGIKVGDSSIGVQTRHSDRLPPAVGAILVVGGAVLMIAGRGRS